MSLQNVGFKLKTLREFNNYSQEYIAKQLNISQAAYSKIENGSTQLSLDHLIKISEIYRISPSDLLGMNDRWNIKEITNSNGVASQNVVINIYSEERLQDIEERLDRLEGVKTGKG
jgi:transcriptional regulator with XRE-family HTH domain